MIVRFLKFSFSTCNNYNKHKIHIKRDNLTFNWFIIKYQFKTIQT